MDFNKLKIVDGKYWSVFLHQDQTALGRLYFWYKEDKVLDLFAHYHPPQTHCADMPHFHDAFIATTSGKKEFILHTTGITYYKGITTDPISREAWQPQKQDEVESKFFAFLATQGRIASYEEYTKIVRTFFERMGVNPKTIEWKDLPDEEVFEQFLQQSDTKKS